MTKVKGKNKVAKKPATKKKQVSKKVTRKALTLIPAPIKEKQLLFILQKTPADHIYTRPAKGGGTWEYVTGVYVKKVLNYTFGWMWDFEIKDKGREGDLVWVQGRLTINSKAGKPMIVKEQFGRADIKFKRGTKTPLDYGNDLKAASTDALKKCASELGIASDVYGKNEFTKIQKADKGFTPPPVEVAKDGKFEEIVPELELDAGKKVNELKGMLKGETDQEKIDNLRDRTGVRLSSGFNITESHANVLIASLLNAETK